jgi:hypothetical protein
VIGATEKKHRVISSFLFPFSSLQRWPAQENKEKVFIIVSKVNQNLYISYNDRVKIFFIFSGISKNRIFVHLVFGSGSCF